MPEHGQTLFEAARLALILAIFGLLLPLLAVHLGLGLSRYQRGALRRLAPWVRLPLALCFVGLAALSPLTGAESVFGDAWEQIFHGGVAAMYLSWWWWDDDDPWKNQARKLGRKARSVARGLVPRPLAPSPT